MGRNDTLPVQWAHLQQDLTKPKSTDPWQQNPRGYEHPTDLQKDQEMTTINNLYISNFL